MAKSTRTSEELKQLIVQIRDKKLLGRGYSRLISEKLQVRQDLVISVSGGKKANIVVIEAIIQLAENNLGIVFELLPKEETNYSEQNLKEKLQFIRENDLLPRNYSRIVSEEIGCTMARVRQVSNLVFFNLDIANAIVNLVENSKEKELIQRAKKILEQAP